MNKSTMSTLFKIYFWPLLALALYLLYGQVWDMFVAFHLAH